MKDSSPLKGPILEQFVTDMEGTHIYQDEELEERSSYGLVTIISLHTPAALRREEVQRIRNEGVKLNLRRRERD